MPIASSPGRVHRMVRGGSYLAELAVALGAAGVALDRGAAPLPTLGVAAGGLVAWGVAWTLAVGGSPARRAVGYRVVGRSGGRPPPLGVVAREGLRLVAGLLVVLSVGFLGALRGPGGDRRWSTVTRTRLAGRPRRRGMGVVASAAAVVAAGCGAGAAATWVGPVAPPALLVLGAVSSTLAAGILAVGREEVRHFDALGLLGDAGDEVPDDGKEVDLLADLPSWPTPHVGWPVASGPASTVVDDPDEGRRWPGRSGPVA